MCDLLCLRPGSLIRTYARLWLSFAISGVMHATSIYILPAPMNVSFRERSLGFVQFFLLQAAAITAEDFVGWIHRRLLPATSTSHLGYRLMGYVWVVCWFGYSLPFFLDILLKMKTFESPMLPFSLLGSIAPYVTMCN